MSKPQVGVITNPNSRKNRLNPGRYERMREVLGPLGLVRRTKDVSAIAEVVREFLDLGVPYMVADGGDGAFHWLMNVTDQVLRERGHGDSPGKWPAILPTNAGTIDFIGRKAEVVGHCDDLLPRLAEVLRSGEAPSVVELPTFRTVGVYGPDADLPGKRFEKIGFAGAMAGVAQRFFDKFYAHDRQDAVGIAYLVGKILASQATRTVPLKWLPMPVDFRYFGESVFEPLPAAVWVDGERMPMDLFRDLEVGAIDINLANVFRFFPFAKSGAALHVQCGNPGALDIVRNLPRMTTGKPLEFKAFVQRQAHEVRIVPEPGYTVDPCIDGELYWGLVEVDIRMGPRIPVVQLRV
jgi:hypothetical protein